MTMPPLGGSKSDEAKKDGPGVADPDQPKRA